jgi:hypothetical protein
MLLWLLPHATKMRLRELCIADKISFQIIKRDIDGSRAIENIVVGDMVMAMMALCLIMTLLLGGRPMSGQDIALKSMKGNVYTRSKLRT